MNKLDLSKINPNRKVTKAEIQGSESYNNGKGINPYKKGTKAYENWNYGWEEAENYDDYLKNYNNQKCLHELCPECHGTGRKKNGQSCVHMLSCPCPRCTPFYL